MSPERVVTTPETLPPEVEQAFAAAHGIMDKLRELKPEAHAAMQALGGFTLAAHRAVDAQSPGERSTDPNVQLADEVYEALGQVFGQAPKV